MRKIKVLQKYPFRLKKWELQVDKEKRSQLSVSNIGKIFVNNPQIKVFARCSPFAR